MNGEGNLGREHRHGAKPPLLRLRAQGGLGRLLLTALMLSPSVALVLADQLVSATHELELMLFNTLLASTPGPITEEVYRAIAGAESTILVVQRAMFAALGVATGLGAVGVFQVWRRPRKRAEEPDREQAADDGGSTLS